MNKRNIQQKGLINQDDNLFNQICAKIAEFGRGSDAHRFYALLKEHDVKDSEIARWFEVSPALIRKKYSRFYLKGGSDGK